MKSRPHFRAIRGHTVGLVLPLLFSVFLFTNLMHRDILATNTQT